MSEFLACLGTERTFFAGKTQVNSKIVTFIAAPAECCDLRLEMVGMNEIFLIRSVILR